MNNTDLMFIKRPSNIIFDIGGVLFQPVIKDMTTKEYVPLEQGITLLKKCYDQTDHQGNKLHKLFILSNWKNPNFQALSQKYDDIFNLFDGVIISGNFYCSKPDIRIYEHLLEQFQLQAQTCVFIDDSSDNIESAQSLGIKGIHCVDFDEVEKKLISLNIL